MTEQGDYSATVPLNEGYNYVAIHASDAVGNAVSRVLTVIAAGGYSPEVERGDRFDREFGNARLPSIAGVKFEDINGDGIRQNTETRLEGVTIYLDLNQNGMLEVDEPMVATDELGFYEFENLIPGTYHVREVVPVGWQQIVPSNGVHVMEVHFGDMIDDANFANQPPGTSLAGLVYEDLDGDGVRDMGEPGVSGATIRLVSDQGSLGDVLTTSLSDGSFLFEGLSAGGYTVSYQTRSGFSLATDRVHSVTLADGEARNNIDFGIYRPITLSGLVFEDVNRDLTKQFFEPTLVEWKIDIDLFNDGVVDSSESSTADGYEFSGLPPGTHTIRAATNDGYDQTLPGNGAGYTVIVQSGASESHLDFGFFDETVKSDPTAIVSGIVFEDLDGDGAIDPGEPRLKDVRVVVESSDGGEVLETARTNSNGQYSVVLLSEVNYRLRIDLTAGLTTSSEDFLAVNPQPGEAISDLHFGVVFGTVVTGVVFDDANANGVFDSQEKVIEGAAVTLTNTSNGLEESFQTEDDGRYEFLLTDEDRYHISSVPGSGYVVTEPTENRYAIVNEGNVVSDGLDFGHFDGTRIAGQVFHDRNENGVRDAGEEGINGQRFQIRDLITQQVVATTETAAIDINGDGVVDAFSEHGAFDVVLPRGPYDVNLLSDSNWPATTATQQSVFLNEPVVTDLLFGVSGRTLAGGTVYIDRNGNGTRDPDELGIDDVLVEAYDGRNQVVVSTRTDSSGAYELAIPADQDLTIVSTLPGGAVWTTPSRNDFYSVNAEEGETIADLDFARFELITLSGTVFSDQDGDGDATGDPPISGWTLVLDLNGDGVFERMTVTDESGNYEFSGVGPGQHIIRQSRPEEWSRTAPIIGQFVIDATSGQDVDGLDFGNRFQLGTLAGQVYRDANQNDTFDEGDSGLNGWTVEIIDPSNQSVVATVVSESVDVNEDGVITAEEVGRYSAVVPPGSYEIRQTIRPGWLQRTSSPSEVIAQIDTTTDWFPEDHPGRAADSVAFSRDGRYVAWGHSRGNSLPGIENRKPRIFVFDRIDGVTEEIDLSELPGFNDPDTTFFSASSSGSSLNLEIDELRISGDGRFVYVRAYLPSFMVGQVPSAYIYDRLEAKFEATGGGVVGIDGDGDTLLSRGGLTDRATGVYHELEGNSVALSWEGTHAAYTKFVSDPDDTSRRQRQLFIYDRSTGEHHDLTDLPLADRGSEVVYGSVAIDDSGQTVVATIGLPTKDDPGYSDYAFELFIIDRVSGLTDRMDTTIFESPGGSIEPGQRRGNLSISGDGRYVFYSDFRDSFRYDRNTGQAIQILPPSSVPQYAMSRDGNTYLSGWQSSSGSFARFSRSVDNPLIDIAAGQTVDGNDFTNVNFQIAIDPIADVTIPEDTVSFAVPLSGIFNVVGNDSSITLTLERPGFFYDDWVSLDASLEMLPGDEESAVVLITPRADDWGINEVYVVATNADGESTRRTIHVSVTPVNDAPILNSSLTYQFPDIQSGEISNGVRVADLLNDAYTMPAQLPVIDPDVDPRGIAVTDVDNSAGTWQFSIDDGSSWEDFPTGAQLAGTILLAMDELARIRLLPHPDFSGSSGITFRAWDRTIGGSGGAVSTPLAIQTGGTSAFSIEQATASIDVLFVDTDQDGVSDPIENAAPNNGDGNNDGVPDRDQPNVASLPNAVDGTYVTIVAPDGTQLIGVEAIENPDPDHSPQTVEFPVGFLNYEIHSIPLGGTVDVDLHFANQVRLTGYYKYGPTAQNPEPHFALFQRTDGYGIQSLQNGKMTLRFTDGLQGDDDLTANGIIVDPGAAGNAVSRAVQNPIVPTDVNNDGQTTSLDALRVINHIARRSEAEDPTSNAENWFFLDVNGDANATPLDALHVINTIARQSNRVEAESISSVVEPLLDPSSVDRIAATVWAKQSTWHRIEPHVKDLVPQQPLSVGSGRPSIARTQSQQSEAKHTAITGTQNRQNELKATIQWLTLEDENLTEKQSRN